MKGIFDVMKVLYGVMLVGDCLRLCEWLPLLCYLLMQLLFHGSSYSRYI